MSQQLTARTLNLGCGEDTRDDAHNVDVEALPGVDETVDLDERPWPWPEGSFRVVYARHVFEHLREPVAAVEEATRVLEPGGTLVLTYPIGHTRFEDPTHKHFWNWHTAAALVGERKHGHEGVDGLTLDARALEWDAAGPMWRWYTTARLRLGGAGPWLGQVPGLAGEVTAYYRRV